MINSEIFIVKRDGKKELFSLDKIRNAIAKAFLSVGSFATQDVITTVLSRVSVSDGSNVEDIQNLMEKRRARYEAAADVIVATDDKTVLQICEELIQKLLEMDENNA